MSDYKSDTLEQRKKAQKEFLELKKMQSGEIAPEKPTEPESPKTLGDKIKNYWYHFKVQTVLALFLVAALAICITQCATKPDYDAELVLYTKNAYSAEQVDLLTEYMTQFFSDLNGDGEIILQISDCSYTTEGTYDMNYTNTLATKLNATIASGVEAQLYILDNEYLEQLNGFAKDYGGFIIESAPMPSAIAELTDSEGNKFPEGLIIGRRVLAGTAMENNSTAVNASENAKAVLEKIRNYQ